MNLTKKQYNYLIMIRNKISNNQASSEEMRNFLDILTQTSKNNRNEIEKFVKEIGFTSLDSFKHILDKKKENEDFIKGLAIIGGGILLAYLLNRK